MRPVKNVVLPIWWLTALWYPRGPQRNQWFQYAILPVVQADAFSTVFKTSQYQLTAPQVVLSYAGATMFHWRLLLVCLRGWLPRASSWPKVPVTNHSEFLAALRFRESAGACEKGDQGGIPPPLKRL